MRWTGVPSLRCALPPRPWRCVRSLRCLSVDNARSDLVLQETALFLYQLQYDSRMQQAMFLDEFDIAQRLRTQRDEVDTLLEKFQTGKGPLSGAAPLSTAFMDLTTTGLNLRSELSQAVEEERYGDAARIRDELSKLNEKVEESEESGGATQESLLFRGVICGWDLGCCESQTWKERVQIEALSQGADQPFYHVLVDERDWPAYTKGPPVGYVAQECLSLVEGLDRFDFEQIRHPFLITMFLGTNNRGTYIPCTPLRNKYKIDRDDSYPPEEEEE